MRCFVVVAGITLGFIGSANAQLTHQDLREFFKSAVRDGRVQVHPPQIRYERRDNVKILSYMAGGSEFDFQVVLDDPVPDAALGAQGKVEGIRRYLNKPHQRRFWKQPIREAESEIARVLSRARTERWGEQRKIKEGDSLGENVEAIFRDAVQRYAVSNGYKFEEPRGAPAPKSASVGFVARPADAVVSYMPAGHWELYYFLARIKRRRNIPRPRWTAIGAARIELGGIYYFKVSSKTAGKAFVTDDPLTITGDVTLLCTLSTVRPIR